MFYDKRLYCISKPEIETVMENGMALPVLNNGYFIQIIIQPLSP